MLLPRETLTAPPAGAILGAGSGQTLAATFTPADSTDYAAAASLQDVQPILTYFAGASAAGTALGSTPPTLPGSYTVFTTFPGTAEDGPAATAPVTFTIDEGRPSVAVSAPIRSPAFGQSVTLTASVTAGAGAASGTVTFYDGSTPLGPATVDGSGMAVLTVSSLSPGGHTIAASFGGNADDLAASSGATSVSVARDATPIVLVPEPVFGKKQVVSLGLEAEIQAIAPGVGVPSGMLTFEVKGKVKQKVRETVLGTAALDGSGEATVTIKPGSVLKQPIKLLYNGDADRTSHRAT